MNNIFDIKRFGKLLLSDLNKYAPRYFGTFMIFLLILPVMWLFIFFVGGAITPSTRFDMILIFTTCCTLIAPFRMYNNVNNKKLGVEFIMLPASALEKFIVMLIYVLVIIPLSFITFSLIIDYILYIIPGEPYSSPLPLDKFISSHTWKLLGSLALTASVPLLGNLFFKKAKMFKTILSVFVFGAIFSIFITIYFKSKVDLIKDNKQDGTYALTFSSGIGNEKDAEINVSKEGTTYYINGVEVKNGDITSINSKFEDVFKVEEKLLYLLFYVVIPGLCFFFTYYRIKKQQL